jgi:diketogulonate reductase-like aldo/keto reductase
MNNTDKTIKLSNGVEIPRVGFGTWRIDNSMVSEVVSWALDAGYRHVDTAKAYGNEEGVGKAINKSSIKREDIFVTTKLAATNDFFRAEKAFYESLQLHWRLSFLKSRDHCGQSQKVRGSF